MRWAWEREREREREGEGEKATAMASLLPRHHDITEDEGEWMGMGGREGGVVVLPQGG